MSNVDRHMGAAAPLEEDTCHSSDRNSRLIDNRFRIYKSTTPPKGGHLPNPSEAENMSLDTTPVIGATPPPSGGHTSLRTLQIEEEFNVQQIVSANWINQPHQLFALSNIGTLGDDISGFNANGDDNEHPWSEMFLQSGAPDLHHNQPPAYAQPEQEHPRGKSPCMQMNEISVDPTCTAASPNVARPQNNGSKRRKTAEQFTDKDRIFVMELQRRRVRDVNIAKEWSKEFGSERTAKNCQSLKSELRRKFNDLYDFHKSNPNAPWHWEMTEKQKEEFGLTGRIFLREWYEYYYRTVPALNNSECSTVPAKGVPGNLSKFQSTCEKAEKIRKKELRVGKMKLAIEDQRDDMVKERGRYSFEACEDECDEEPSAEAVEEDVRAGRFVSCYRPSHGMDLPHHKSNKINLVQNTLGQRKLILDLTRGEDDRRKGSTISELQNQMCESQGRISSWQNEITEGQNKIFKEENKISETKNKISKEQNKVSEMRKEISALLTMANHP